MAKTFSFLFGYDHEDQFTAATAAAAWREGRRLARYYEVAWAQCSVYEIEYNADERPQRMRQVLGAHRLGRWADL